MHFLSPNNGESGRNFTRICSLEFVKEKRIKSASNEDTLGSVDAQIKSGTRPFLAWVDRLVLTRRIKNMLSVVRALELFWSTSINFRACPARHNHMIFCSHSFLIGVLKDEFLEYYSKLVFS